MGHQLNAATLIEDRFFFPDKELDMLLFFKN